MKCTNKSHMAWGIAFLLQFFLFRTYCYREILSYIPEWMDQVGYANVTYQIYDQILNSGILQGIKFGINSSVNSGMTLIGAVHLFLFGFSRFSLLLPNFLACFLCEYSVSAVLNRVTKNKFISLIYCGLFLMTTAIFAGVGGIFDYRWDFMAFCVYTIWLAYLIEFLYSNSRKAFYSSAIAGGVLLFIRLNIILYLVGILAVLTATKLLAGSLGKDSIKKGIKYAGVMFLAGGWYLALNFSRFINYYFSAIFTGSAKEAWKAHLPFVDNLLLYPKLLWTSLMGKTQLAVLLALLIFGLAAMYFSRQNSIKNKKLPFFALFLAWVVPYGILTILDNKNSAAAMVLISPLLLCPVLVLGELQIRKKVFPAIALIVLAMGAGHFFINMAGQYPYHTREEAQEYVKANSIIVNYMEQNDMDTAQIIFDRLHQTFFPISLEVYSREVNERSISITHAITAMKNDWLMTSFGEEEIREGLQRADFLVINKQDYTEDSKFVSDIILRENKDLLARYAAKNMDLIGEVSWGDIALEIYARPAFQIQLQADWSDWCGPDGTVIHIWEAQNMTGLLLEGNLDGLYELYSEKQAVHVRDQSGEPVPALFTMDASHNRYRIKIDIRMLNPQHDIIYLSFDQFFIPNELHGNGDLRKLTIRYPDKICLENDDY